MSKSSIELLSNKGPGTIQLDLNFKPGIACIVIHNPERHNALSGKMMVEFYNAIIEIERHVVNNQDLVALVVMGANKKSFCAGLDLTFAQEFITGPEVSFAINEVMHDTVERISRLPLITMAVVTGGAIGGGSELLTGFDFICMSKQSGFVHFVQTRMGISSPWGGMRRLIQCVGKKKALKWMAGGYRLNAETCFKEGFVDILADRDEHCLEQAMLFLKPFISDNRTEQRISPHAVRGMKTLVIKQLKENDWEYEKEVLSSTLSSSKL